MLTGIKNNREIVFSIRHLDCELSRPGLPMQLTRKHHVSDRVGNHPSVLDVVAVIVNQRCGVRLFTEFGNCRVKRSVVSQVCNLLGHLV